MRLNRVGPGHRSLSVALVAFCVVALLVSVPIPGKATASLQPSAVQPAATSTYAVTWNGVDVSTAGTSSSALAIDFSQSANLNFTWSGTSAPVTISDARLQMYYFGFAVSTRDQIVSNPPTNSIGHIPLSWTPLSINYLLEGVYRLTASFIAPNGTTMFSENFYVRGNAPLGFVAVIPIVLLLIVVYELYGLVRSGRYAAFGRKSAGPPPSSPPPTSETETPAGESPPPEEPGAGTPPPSGGGS